MSAPSPGKTSQPPKLVHLALNALCRNWSSATALDGLSTDLAKLVWAHVKDHHARQGITPVPCAAMYPLVRASWQIQTLDLSDAGKWITDTALQAGICPTAASWFITSGGAMCFGTTYLFCVAVYVIYKIIYSIRIL